MRAGILRSCVATFIAATISTVAAGEQLKNGLPTAAAYNWSGITLGIDGGYGVGDPSIGWSGNEDSYFSSGGLERSRGVKPHGFLGGLRAGYDYQFGRYVAGIVTDFALTNISGSGASSTGVSLISTDNSALPLFTGTNQVQFQTSSEQSLRVLGTLRGRAGVLVADNVLLYGTGGLAYGRATMSAAVTNTGVYTEFFTNPDNVHFFSQQFPSCSNICSVGRTSQWLVGGTAGAGVEIAVIGQWTARAEYIYYNLGRLSVGGTDPRFPSTSFSASALFAGHVARFGLSYRFD
jgi:outer membrane immunogenic protein